MSKRERLGDIEVDLMMGKNHQGALLVMTDRASAYAISQAARQDESGSKKGHDPGFNKD